MFEQYLRIKEGYPDALLFYRMGDFYELFFEDAEVASRELQIALTSRNPNAEAPIPMCGVPWHAAEGYVSQLLNKGYKIAFCDQVEDPRAAKGLVERAVTRVYTPGTAVEDVSLEPKGHTYLGALFWSADTDRGGFAWVDVSTGYWAGLHVKKSQELWQWAQKIAPRELLFEVTSALATVGLSIGATPQLDGIGKVLIILTMFIGRIGPLTMFMLLDDAHSQTNAHYPYAKITLN